MRKPASRYWRTYEKFFKGKNDLKDVELLGLVTTPGNSLINMKPRRSSRSPI
jgi:hypothetical protein